VAHRIDGTLDSETAYHGLLGHVRQVVQLFLASRDSIVILVSYNTNHI
jgi:hypothetical protein